MPARRPGVPNVAGKFIIRIRTARKALGLTMKDCGAALGPGHHSYWRTVESGGTANPSLDTVAAMAGVVGLHLELTDWTEEERAAVRDLVRWYGRQTDRGWRMPAALASALVKIEREAGK